jgi:hypothetical protein
MRRHLPLLLLFYVTLDFGNPLMPGAVRFEAGSIEVVQADRTARATCPAAVPTWLAEAFPTCTIVPMAAALRLPIPVPRTVSAIAFRTVHRALPQRRSTPPAPSDDH